MHFTEWVTPFQLLGCLGLRPGDSVSKISDLANTQVSENLCQAVYRVCHCANIELLSVIEIQQPLRTLPRIYFVSLKHNFSMCWSLHGYVKPSWKRWLGARWRKLHRILWFDSHLGHADVRLLVKHVLFYMCSSLSLSSHHFHFSYAAPLVGISIPHSNQLWKTYRKEKGKCGC